MKCCFLSTDDLDGYVVDDGLAIAPLREIGWDVETVSWKTDCDWNRFDVVVVRTTWDYHHQPQEFCRRLEQIDKSTAVLENSFGSIVWNLEKTYLEDLARSGVRIVPTVFGSLKIEEKTIEVWQDYFECDQLVIKPTISATAMNTFLVDSLSGALTVFDETPYMVQPFMGRIKDEGELSLFFFDGDFSHAISKTPDSDDFRVQEEFGGTNKLIAADAVLREVGQLVIDVLPETPLYARVDVVKDNEGEYALMELELIEPALYFRYDQDSPSRFAESLNKRFNEL